MVTLGLVNWLKKHGETKKDTWTEKAYTRLIESLF